MGETINELCPYCNTEVELKDAHKLTEQECPVCHKNIMPCNLCDTCDNKCGRANIRR